MISLTILTKRSIRSGLHLPVFFLFFFFSSVFLIHLFILRLSRVSFVHLYSSPVTSVLNFILLTTKKDDLITTIESYITIRFWREEGSSSFAVHDARSRWEKVYIKCLGGVVATSVSFAELKEKQRAGIHCLSLSLSLHSAAVCCCFVCGTHKRYALLYPWRTQTPNAFAFVFK